MASSDSQNAEARALSRAQRALRDEYRRVRDLAHDDPQRVAYGERLKAQRGRLEQLLEVERRREST